MLSPIILPTLFFSFKLSFRVPLNSLLDWLIIFDHWHVVKTSQDFSNAHVVWGPVQWIVFPILSYNTLEVVHYSPSDWL